MLAMLVGCGVHSSCDRARVVRNREETADQ